MTTTTMSPDKARSIIIEASKTHGDEPPVFEGDVPSDDDQAISEAEQLVQLASDAREQGFENESILAVLAKYEVDGGSPSDPDMQNGAVAKSKGVEPPWPDYGDDSVSEICNALWDLDDDSLAEVYDYEAATKNRKTIIKTLEEIATRNGDGDDDVGDADDITWDALEEMDRDEMEDLVEQFDLEVAYNARTKDDKLRERIAEALDLSEDDPEPDPDDGDPEPESDDPAPEPWRGYRNRKVDQILKKLPKLDDDDLALVYDYEAENKDRKAIFKALDKIYTERHGDDDPEGEEASASRGEAEDEQGSEGSEGRADGDGAAEPSAETASARSQGSRSSAKAASEDSDAEHDELIQAVTDRVDEEHMSVPQRPPVERVEMPFDLTECDDTEIRRLHSAFTSYYARAAYVAKLEHELERACKHVADKKLADVMRNISLDEKGKERQVTLVKSEAETDDEVRLWREREFTHGQISSSFKKDVEIYEQNITSLSREWTMRTTEYNHSGPLPDRPKSRRR
jgi:hypothetical protein